jgi:hypothetical protein
MKHVTYSEKSLLIGDEAADLLLEYASALVNVGRGDTVDVHAFGSDGQEVVATFLLEAGAPLMAETTHTSMNEPDNWEAIAYMREHIDLLTKQPPTVAHESPDTLRSVGDLDLDA